MLDLKQIINDFVEAWDALPKGDHSINAIEKWLNSPKLVDAVIGLKDLHTRFNTEVIGIYGDTPPEILPTEVTPKLKVCLQAIAEGYEVRVAEDRYIVVDNPDYKIELGNDPCIVIDVRRLLAPSQSEF